MGRHRRAPRQRRTRKEGDRLGLITATVLIWLGLCTVIMFWAPSGRYLHDAKTLAVALWPW